MLFIAFCFAHFVVIFFLLRLSMRFRGYFVPKLFDSVLNFLLTMIILGVVATIVLIELWPQFWGEFVSFVLILFTILYPVELISDFRSAKIKKWELIISVVLYLVGVASTVIVVVSMLNQ